MKVVVAKGLMAMRNFATAVELPVSQFEIGRRMSNVDDSGFHSCHNRLVSELWCCRSGGILRVQWYARHSLTR